MTANILRFPYGKRLLEHDFSGEDLRGVLVSKLHGFRAAKSGDGLVRDAMAAPVGSPTLRELARGKRRVVLVASDHTRPVPSRVIVPSMLSEIREGNPSADITILVATGCHRATTRAELSAKFGEEIVAREKIVVHDCDDAANLVDLGTLPSGGACRVNRLAAEADLLCAEGFIEPHFFAGSPGGRKSVLPGIASRETVLANHCSEFIADPRARAGVLDGNPVHRDMLWAARAAGLAYIVNVVLGAEKEVVAAFAGDMEAAHLAGTEFLSRLCAVPSVPADVVVSTNGGYPLDQNIYQSVKGMTAAEACVNPGGVIVMLSRSDDGHGGESFLRQASAAPSATLAAFLARGRGETEPDQWQTQVFLRVLSRASVVYVSDAPDAVVRALHMHPAHSLGEALALAKRLLGNPRPSVAAIPDGISVTVRA